MNGVPSWLGRWRTWAERPRNRVVLVGFGALLFTVALVVAVVNFPDRSDGIRWLVLAWVLLALAPMAMLVSAVEYQVTARIAGNRIGLADAFRVSVISSLGNLLPLPGSFLVRAGHLMGRGVSWGRAAAAPAVLGMAWVGVGALAAGVLVLAQTDQAAWGALFVAGGSLALGGSVAALVRLTGSRMMRWLVPVIGIEALAVMISAIRYYLVLTALGFESSWESAAVLALASVLAVATGIVPGGLGVREALSGVFVLMTGLEASVGVLAAAVNRVIGLVALGGVGAGLVLTSSPTAEQSSRGPE